MAASKMVTLNNGFRLGYSIPRYDPVAREFQRLGNPMNYVQRKAYEEKVREVIRRRDVERERSMMKFYADKLEQADAERIFMDGLKYLKSPEEKQKYLEEYRRQQRESVNDVLAREVLASFNNAVPSMYLRDEYRPTGNDLLSIGTALRRTSRDYERTLFKAVMIKLKMGLDKITSDPSLAEERRNSSANMLLRQIFNVRLWAYRRGVGAVMPMVRSEDPNTPFPVSIDANGNVYDLSTVSQRRTSGVPRDRPIEIVRPRPQTEGHPIHDMRLNEVPNVGTRPQLPSSTIGHRLPFGDMVGPPRAGAGADEEEEEDEDFRLDPSKTLVQQMGEASRKQIVVKASMEEEEELKRKLGERARSKKKEEEKNEDNPMQNKVGKVETARQTISHLMEDFGPDYMQKINKLKNADDAKRFALKYGLTFTGRIKNTSGIKRSIRRQINHRLKLIANADVKGDEGAAAAAPSRGRRR